MMSEKSQRWIEEGYDMISKTGISSIKVESIARKINKNKSSFYYYFGDTEQFLDELLAYHITRVEQFAVVAKACKQVRPDLLQLFVEYKTDFFFHKQLRINRDNPQMKKCFETAFEKVDQAIIEQWAAFLDLTSQPLLARTFLHLVAENFLLQITESTFNYQWLDNYLGDVNSIFRQMNTGLRK